MEKSSTLRRITKSKTFTLVLVFILVVVVFTIIKPTFLRPVNLRNIVNSATVSGITMVGLICLLISGNMDLSTGNVSVMSAIVMCTVSQMGAPWFLALLIGLLFGALCGAINAFLGYVCGIFPFIATLAMGTIWQGLGNFLTNAQNVVISDRSLWWLGSGEILGVPFAFVLMCVLMIVYGLILAKTKFGRTIYMMGGNFQAARLAGINLKKNGTILMINCSVLSALAGCVLAARMHSINPSTLLAMDAITAAVLGGVAFTGGSGTMFGGFIGLLLLSSFQNGLQVVGLDTYWRTVASGLLLALALTFDFINAKRMAKQLKQKVD